MINMRKCEQENRGKWKKPSSNNVVSEDTQPGLSATKKVSRSAEKLKRVADQKQNDQDADLAVTQHDSASDNEENEDNDTEYRVVQSGAMRTLIESLPCKICRNKTLTLKFTRIRGFSSKMTVFCLHCEEEQSSSYTSPALPSGGLDVNKRMSEAFLSMGVNYADIQKFGVSLNMHIPARKNFNRYMKVLFEETFDQKNKVLEWARVAVRQAHCDIDPFLEDEEIMNITVSFDGTWHQRGHTSNHGIGFIIDVLTGLVIDYVILSKFCLLCSQQKEKLEGELLKEWEEKHQPVCEINYSGSSNAMKTKAAEILCSRSVEECGFRYTGMLSDGDAASFLHIQRLEPYGKDCTIHKEDCINHVGKRLYTGLQETVNKWKARKVTLGGKKAGALTIEKMKRLQNYFTSAIRKNAPNIQQMKQAILATPYHCMSTDSEPRHEFYPGGEQSWCFYNRALSKEEDPPSHSKETMTTILDAAVEKILLVYERLASEELLQRCTKLGTQNSNESLHSCIWLRQPKHKSTSKAKLEIAVIGAVGQFNMGYHASFVLKNNRVFPEQQRILEEVDRVRLARSKSRATEGSRKARKEKKKKLISQLAREKEKEGITYKPGKF